MENPYKANPTNFQHNILAPEQVTDELLLKNINKTQLNATLERRNKKQDRKEYSRNTFIFFGLNPDYPL